jgi:ectoine hydroxylase-related dioxygenase (phytanoyl-CoA dioxygenase family)
MFELSESQLGQYREEGFVVLDEVIDAATVDELRACFARLFEGRFETGVRPDEVNWQQGSGDPTLTRQICNAWKADRGIARSVLRADFGRAIAQLGGWRGTRLMIDNVLWKPVGARALGHHQDSAYLSWFRPSDLISLWIALDETSAEGGTVEFVRGSHQWRHLPPKGEFHGPEDYRRPMIEAARLEGVEPEIVHVEVPLGGGSFHHGWTWHGSGPNRGARDRRALVIHAMPCDVEFDPQHFSEGIGPIYGRYRRLDDNAMDENHFPVTWRRDGYSTPGIAAHTKGR